MEVITHIYPVAVAFFAAAIASVTGGAGMIIIPTLIISGLNPTAALATNKMIATCNNVSNTVAFHKKGHLVSKQFIVMGVIVAVSSVIGTFLNPHIPQELFKHIISLLLITLSIKEILNVKISRYIPFVKKSKWLIFLVIGIYSGAIGIGIGPLFIFFSMAFLKISNIKSAAFSKLMCLFVNSVSFLTFAIFIKAVNYKIGLPMAISGFIGAYYGTFLFSKFSERKLKIIIVSFVIISSILMFF